MSVLAWLRRLPPTAAAAVALGATAQPPPARPAAGAPAAATALQRLGAPPPPAPTGDRAVFVSYGCYQCHGYEGQGGEALRIGPTAYPFDVFAARVRKPANEMPAYAPEVLSDAALQAIYRYLRSRPEPAPIRIDGGR